MNMRHLALALALVVSTGCGKTLQLNLVVNDPCNQSILADQTLGMDHMELTITAPDLSEPESMTWKRGDRQGSQTGLTPVENATVTVTGRVSNGAGAPADAVAAIGVGYLDLTGGDADVVNLNVVFGRVGWFMSTTDAGAATNGNILCSALSAERRGHSASLLPDGRVFVAGGESVKPAATTFWETTEYYEPATGLFVRGPNMKWVRKAHSATVLNDGTILLAGGIGLNGTTVDTWKVALIFDPTSESFLNPIPMRSQRANHTATLLGDGRVLLAGGTQGTHELETTEIFDPVAQTFCDGPSLSPQPRAFHSAVRIGESTVALLGGVGAGQVLSSVQFVTVSGCAQGAAVNGPALAKARSHLLAALVPGRDAVVVAGGFDAVATAIENGKGIDSVEIIKLNRSNPGTSTLAACNLKLLNPRGAATLAEIPTGLLVFGGLNAQGLALSSAETLRFGAANDCDVSFTASAGQLTVPRAGAQATAMVGGDVLVSGGFNNVGGSVVSVAQGEIYVRQR
jgi:hypothetical protein